MPNEPTVNKLILAALENRRGYADEFCWPDREIEEWGVISYMLRRALENKEVLIFGEVIRRGRGNDPPDCESLNQRGERIAFEVTELVDGKAIGKSKNERKHGRSAVEPVDWSKNAFKSQLSRRLSEKFSRFEKLKDAPYPGGYVVVVYSGELNLTADLVDNYLKDYLPPVPPPGTMAFLLLTYFSSLQANPCFRIV